jgi:nitroreductase
MNEQPLNQPPVNQPPMSQPPMSLGDAIRSTGAVRQFTDEPVDDATVYAILDDARFAPSGGNRQSWRVVVVKDPTIRTRLAEVMRPVWNEYIAIGASGVTPFSSSETSVPSAPPANDAASIPNDLIDAIVDVPVVLVIAADLSLVAMMDRDLDRKSITGGGSIYPFCWNLLLAARSRGLGGVLTTFLARAEREAAPILGLPANHAIAGVIFLGRPVHQPTRLRRQPVETFTTIDTYTGPAFELNKGAE